MKLEKIKSKILNDENLLNLIEDNIQEIKKDGKININDIPEFLNIVTLCYNNMNKIYIKKKNIPAVLEILINAILDKFELVPDEEEEEFRRVLNMGIKLILTEPKVLSKIAKIIEKIKSMLKKLTTTKN